MTRRERKDVAGTPEEPTEWEDSSVSARKKSLPPPGRVNEPTRSIRSPDDKSALRPSDEPPAKDHRLGRTLVGRYRIEQLIGKGGMGRVYLATQIPLNRAVAVKILSPEFQKKDPQFPRRFFLEAATAAQLNHPNTITVFDYGETEEGELFIAMEFLKGRPLSRAIASDGSFSAERTLHIGMQIVRALREAHQKGIIHRDLKPGNIMLLEEGDDVDYAKVLDFGLVKLFHTESSNHQQLLEQLPPGEDDVGELTRAGMFLGSPKYMSPEQIEGHSLDPRTDIYSLGVIMFQMISGRVPFRGNTSVEIVYKHVNQPIPSIHEVNPEADAPPELERLISKCLEKDRDRRPASMGDLLVDMKDVKRLITGVSSVSGLSLESMGSYAASHPPVTSSIAPAPVPVSIPPTPPAREAAFLEPEASDDTPSASASLARLPKRQPTVVESGSKLIPSLAIGALILGVGAAAYFLSVKPSPTPVIPPIVEPTTVVPPPPPPTAPKPSTVIVTSRPDGAQVFEKGALLGTTPFEYTVEARADGNKTHQFVFKKEGFADASVEEVIEGDRVKIVATLDAIEVPPKPELVAPPPAKKPNPSPPAKKPTTPQPNKNSTDYKENPY